MTNEIAQPIAPPEPACSCHADLARVMRFIRTIRDDGTDKSAWYRELRAIRREVKT
jgi:hypothetical protein